MKLKHNYIFLSTIETGLSLSQLVQFYWYHGFDVPLFIDQVFNTRISSFFSWNAIVSALALLVFIITDGNRNRIKKVWLPIIGTFTVGVSQGLPMYLYFRETALGNME